LREAPSNLQFASRAGYLWVVLAFVVAALLVTWWLRNGRFGAWLQAVRDNEDAARAVGVNPFRVKLGAIGISAAFMGAAGAFYVQVFQYIDPGIAYGSTTSVEALVAAIVGGVGTLWGPVLGAVVLHLLADLTRNLFGELPGINMVIYGTVLVLIVIFLPRGIAGLGLSVRQLQADIVHRLQSAESVRELVQRQHGFSHCACLPCGASAPAGRSRRCRAARTS